MTASPPQSCCLFISCLTYGFTELVKVCATSELIKIEDLHLGTTISQGVGDHFQRSFST